MSIAALLALAVSGPIVQGPSPDHPAYDIACRTGAPVHAVFDGTTRTGYSSRMGNQVWLEGTSRNAYYAHLDTVEPGAIVKAGQVIGTCGNTGSWSYGPHLHIEIK